MQTWQLQEAKARLSEVIRQASQSPQEITLRGQPAVVVISKDEYNKLIHQPQQSLVQFLQSSPLAQVQLDLERDKSLTRDIDL